MRTPARFAGACPEKRQIILFLESAFAVCFVLQGIYLGPAALPLYYLTMLPVKSGRAGGRQSQNIYIYINYSYLSLYFLDLCYLLLDFLPSFLPSFFPSFHFFVFRYVFLIFCCFCIYFFLFVLYVFLCV